MHKFIYLSDNKETKSWKVRDVSRELEISFLQNSDRWHCKANSYVASIVLVP